MTMAPVRRVAVSVVRVMSRGGRPALTMEGQVDEPEHVDRRQERGHRANRPEQCAAVVVLRPDKCLVEDLVLEKNPERSGTPAIASAPIRNVQ